MPAPAQAVNPPAWHGKDSILCMSTSRAGTPAPVALIKEWTLDRTSDKVETTALGDGNKTYVKGLDDIKGTFTGEWNSLDDTLFDAAESPDGVQMEIWPNKYSPVCFKGPAWIDVSVKAGVTSAVEVDGSFSANGTWTRTAPTAATGATAGSPGTFTPAGSAAPVSLTALQTANPTVVASPTTAWTTGQHVVLGDLSHAHWNGTAWATGNGT